jgi:hypothetical protein
MIDLKPFCSINASRPGIMQPFRDGDFVYATDTRIILKIPATDHPPITASYHPLTPTSGSIAALGWRHNEITNWKPCSEWFEKCGYCNGTTEHKCNCGVTHQCGHCSGTGLRNRTRNVTIGAATIHRNYAKLIWTLPNAEVEADPKQFDACVAFRFTGGEGLVMGLRTS